MKEIVASIKKKIEIIENTMDNIPEKQRTDLTIKLRRIDRDLRGVILFQLAVNK